jgi:hypothetical protein
MENITLAIATPMNDFTKLLIATPERMLTPSRATSAAFRPIACRRTPWISQRCIDVQANANVNPLEPSKDLIAPIAHNSAHYSTENERITPVQRLNGFHH